MSRSNETIALLLIHASLLAIIINTNALDTINTTQMMKDGDKLVSSNGKFEMGFFRPGNSKNRYIGIWYRNIPSLTVVWVANRDRPLTNATDAVLRLTESGVLSLLISGNYTVVWYANISRAAAGSPVAQLLDSGNLVIREANEEEYIWQSFDYPTDTLLPGMKLGKNLVTGRENYITSWRSSDDPGTGEFTYHLDPTGYPQAILRQSSNERYRTGPWNGVGYSGIPGLKNNTIYSFELVMNEKEVYYHYWLLTSSVVTRFVMNQSGVAQRWTWVDRTKDWITYLKAPIDNCDTYRLCGPYGSCNVANSPICGCLEKFVPRYMEEWVGADWFNGCVRRSPLDCTSDGFVRYSDIKLPDTNYSWFNRSMTLKECREACRRNCSCTAFTNLDITNGGTGCLIWVTDLVDIKVVYGAGQDIYIRMASSELDSGRKKRRKLVVGLTSFLGIFLGMCFAVLICKRKKIYVKLMKEGMQKERDENMGDLPLFSLSTISKATNNFSPDNKLGEGGFGPVYKGTLEDGQEIGVKRLSKTSTQGADEFKNEVIFVAKLQHRNLVKLLGCCIEGHENMLVYEYMPNRSLDLILSNYQWYR